MDAAIDALRRRLRRAGRIVLIGTTVLDIVAIAALAWLLNTTRSPELVISILAGIGSLAAGSALLVYAARRGTRQTLEFTEAMRPRATHVDILFGQGLLSTFDNGVWLVYSQGGLMFAAFYATDGTIAMARPDQMTAWRTTFRRGRRVGWATNRKPPGTLAARLDAVRSALGTSWSRAYLLEAKTERIASTGGPTWLAYAMFGPLPPFRRIRGDLVRTQLDAVRELLDEARTSLQMRPVVPAPR